MLERPAGSYIKEKGGDIKPNLKDPAMRERENLKKKAEAKEKAETKKKEVSNNATK